MYWFVYLIFFYLIENVWVARHYVTLDSPIDHAIPFIPAFVLAYDFWFVYHVWALLPPFIDEDPEEYYRASLALYSGMTVFIIVSILFPNQQALRPAHLGNDIFSMLVGSIYAADTPTNIMPSIHVYNALVANTAICRRAKVRHKPLEAVLSIFACVMITLATVFIKQHTIKDLIGAGVMYLVFYFLFFKKFKIPDFLKD